MKFLETFYPNDGWIPVVSLVRHNIGVDMIIDRSAKCVRLHAFYSDNRVNRPQVSSIIIWSKQWIKI